MEFQQMDSISFTQTIILLMQQTMLQKEAKFLMVPNLLKNSREKLMDKIVAILHALNLWIVAQIYSA
jgi:hypothetical protein